ncbi:MAG: EamA family transporter [Nostocales cyanobacterium]|nr:MAG: EamA family transporter [Nostocales cyanobacterium]
MILFLSKMFSRWVAASVRLRNSTHQLTQNNLHLQGIILFVIINIIWGTTFPLIEKIVVSLAPSVLIATRFAVAALFFSFNLRRLNAILLRDGLILGILFFAYLATETIALESIHANQASFIISLSAIIVPLMGWLFGRYLPLKTFLAAGLSVIGIGVMCWGEGILGIGNLLMLGDAFLYAIYTLILEKVASRHPSLSLTSVQLFVIAIMGLIWSNTELITEWKIINQNWGVIIYLGLVATALVIWLQTIAQRWIGSEEAALLYTLEPVFAAIFSFLLLGEQLGINGFIGAAFVLSAILISQHKAQNSKQDVGVNIKAATSPVLVVAEENIR